MDKDRHLISDKGFDLFERASYGKGCEVPPFDHNQDNHKNPKCKFQEMASVPPSEISFFQCATWDMEARRSFCLQPSRRWFLSHPSWSARTSASDTEKRRSSNAFHSVTGEKIKIRTTDERFKIFFLQFPSQHLQLRNVRSGSKRVEDRHSLHPHAQSRQLALRVESLRLHVPRQNHIAQRQSHQQRTSHGHFPWYR